MPGVPMGLSGTTMERLSEFFLMVFLVEIIKVLKFAIHLIVEFLFKILILLLHNSLPHPRGQHIASQLCVFVLLFLSFSASFCSLPPAIPLP